MSAIRSDILVYSKVNEGFKLQKRLNTAVYLSVFANAGLVLLFARFRYGVFSFLSGYVATASLGVVAAMSLSALIIGVVQARRMRPAVWGIPQTAAILALPALLVALAGIVLSLALRPQPF